MSGKITIMFCIQIANNYTIIIVIRLHSNHIAMLLFFGSFPYINDFSNNHK